MAQIATGIEESKRLLELGINPNTADMYYQYAPNSEKLYVIPKIGNPSIVRLYGKECIPAWSLAALLDVLDSPQLSKDKLGSGKVGWMVSAYPDNCRYDSCWHDNPVDACYEMVIKLHELNLL